MSLPIYLLKVTDDDSIGWDYTALVDKPATGELWMAFTKQPEYKYQFQTINEEKRIVMGALMVANLPILRKNPDGSEFLVVFDAENIDLALQKVAKLGFQKNVNEMHDPNKKVADVFMYQQWIVNKELGIGVPTGFNELPDGSAFGVFKVNNDQVWQDIKAGKFQGFSIEGKFVQEPLPDPTDEDINNMVDALEGSDLK